MIFLPRSILPPKLLVIVRKVDERNYEVTTEPKLEPILYATFVMTFKQCARGFNVKLSGGKLNLFGENPDFNLILECLRQGSAIPVELKIT
ncbi:MAG: hypothetical protein QW175_05090 [Candidatus Bathyarchaeia archaeon]